MVSNCAARKCNNLQHKSSNIQFHRFPFRRPNILKLWVKAIGRTDWKPNKNDKLCSAHFLESDYQYRPFADATWLKPDAVPSIFNFPKHQIEQNASQVKSESLKNPTIPATSLMTFAEKMNEETKVCRLCLTILDNNGDVIEEVAKRMIDILLLNLDLFETKNPVMCTSCAEKLQRFFDFKTFCMQANDPLRHTSVAEDTYVDNVCRVCEQCEERQLFVSIRAFEKKSDLLREMLVICLPELNLSCIADFVICRHCLDSLNGYFSFMMVCQSVEEKIKEFRKTHGVILGDQIELNKIIWKLSANVELDNVGRHGNVVIKKEENFIQDDETMSSIIEDESVVIKDEYMDAEEQDFKVEVDERAAESKRIADLIKSIQNDLPPPTDSNKPPFKCDLCPYETKHKSSFTRHHLIHKDISEITTYQCEKCPFKAKHKYILRNHTLIHKDPSEIKTFKCDLCPYQAKRKIYLSRHSLIHQNRSSMPTYSCEKCPYKTIRRYHLKSHLLMHETESYKCDSCPYETKQRMFFVKHLSVHKNPSKTTAYCCEKCSYTTARKAYLKLHEQTHDDTSETVTYKCDLCPYESKWKQQVAKHMLIHKDKSKITMFKCELCPYEAKRKFQVTLHMVNHKGRVKTETFKCADCSYVTEEEANLKEHQLTHDDV